MSSYRNCCSSGNKKRISCGKINLNENPANFPKLSTIDEVNPCSRINKLQTSSQIISNILDIATTIIQVLCNCGIHPSKAQKALDVIVYSFIHFEEVQEHPGRKCKKRIRKMQFIRDLMENSEMCKSEAKMTYSITKAAFKAFYEQQVVSKYDAIEIKQCEWNNAVEKTIDAFSRSGATKSESELTGKKISAAYQNYLSRLKQRDRSNTLGHYDDHSRAGCHCCKQDGSFGFLKNGISGSSKNGTFGSPKNEISGFSKNGTCGSSKNGTSPRVSQNMNRCEEFGRMRQDPDLSGQLIGEYCNQGKLSCADQGRNPLLVKDCMGRIFMMVQGNKVYFDPKILNAEAKRATRDLYPDSGSDCGC